MDEKTAKYLTKIREIPLASAPEIARTVAGERYRVIGNVHGFARLFSLSGELLGWVVLEAHGVRTFK